MSERQCEICSKPGPEKDWFSLWFSDLFRVLSVRPYAHTWDEGYDVVCSRVCLFQLETNILSGWEKNPKNPIIRAMRKEGDFLDNFLEELHPKPEGDQK